MPGPLFVYDGRMTGNSEVIQKFGCAGKDLHLRLEVMSLSYCPTLLPRHNTCIKRKMVRVAGVEPAWTCAQDMWVAATLHPDRGKGLFSPPPFTLSRKRPGATCAPRPPDHAALPSPRR